MPIFTGRYVLYNISKASGGGCCEGISHYRFHRSHCGYAGVKGEIAVGADADLVTFDDNIVVSGVWLMGEKVNV